MKTSEVTVGTKVNVPGGESGTVESVEVVKSGKRGRPTTIFKVGGKGYRAKDLKAVK